jgi:hypothetical protein
MSSANLTKFQQLLVPTLQPSAMTQTMPTAASAATATLSTQLTTALNQPSFTAQLAALQSLITSAQGQTFSAQDRKLFSTQLSQLTSKQSTTDPTVLSSLNAILSSASSVGLLTATQASNMQQQLTTAGTTKPTAVTGKTAAATTTTTAAGKSTAAAVITAPVTSATLSGQLTTVTSQPSFMDQLQGLQSLLANAQGQTFTAQDQQTFQTQLQQIIGKPNQINANTAASLTGILNNAVTVGLLPSTQVATLQQQITAKVPTGAAATAVTTITSANLSSQLDAVLGRSFMDQLKSLQALITNAQGQTFTTQDQQTFQTKFLLLVAKQATDDPTTLTSLSDTLDTALSAGLISDTQHTNLQQQLSVQIATATENRQQTDAGFTEKISTANTATSFADLLSALQDLVAFAAGKTFTQDEQTQFSQSLLQLFSQCPSGDTASLQSVVNLTTSAHKSSLTTLLPKDTFAAIIQAGKAAGIITTGTTGTAGTTGTTGKESKAAAPATTTSADALHPKESKQTTGVVIRGSGRKGEITTPTTGGAAAAAKAAKAAQATTSTAAKK